MKYISILSLLVIIAACSPKQADEIYKENKVSLPFKLGKIEYDDKRNDVVSPEISLSTMPSKENEKTISPDITPELRRANETIIKNAFRGNALTYDVIIVINKAKKTLKRTWQESKEQSEVEITIELTNKEDKTQYKSMSMFALDLDAPSVSDKHAQEMFEITFKNALYLGLKKVQDEIK